MFWGRKKFKSRKRKDTERRTRTIICASVLVGVAVILIGSSYISGLHGFTIDVVQIEGAEVVDEADIETVVFDAMDGRYMWLYARSNALMYPKRKVRAAIAEAFPRIKDIEIELDSMDVMHIAITERDPYALWCGREYVPETLPEDENCGFIDEEGVVYADAPSFSGDVFLRFYGERNDNFFLTPDVFDRVRSLVFLLEDADISPTIGVVRPNGNVEITVNDPFGYSSVLYIDIENEPQETVRNLLTLYNELGVDSSPHLEYVDLRFGNRVFYNFAGDSSFTATSSSVQ